MQKLHLGCGRNILPDWINLDVAPAPGVDVVADLDDCVRVPLPFASDTFEEIYASHLIEHLRNPLPFMQELHRIAKPGAKALFKVPYGSSDDAFTDPTHVRCYFRDSFSFFSQPVYWRADYGYRGDWQPENIVLKVPRRKYDGKSAAEIIEAIDTLRNVVIGMEVVVVAVKPIRPPSRELIRFPNFEIRLTG